jgi:D-tyrosyl-tRNA(Tyr) deacylase
MRAVVQRVSRARVTVEDAPDTWREAGAIGPGVCVLLGCGQGDTDVDGRWMAEKIAGLRIFEDDAGKMNRDVKEAGGAVLCVSQFTLFGDARKGRRPGFTDAMPPDPARELYVRTCAFLRELGLTVAEGEFRTTMRVELVNEGPVTLLLDSRKLF